LTACAWPGCRRNDQSPLRRLCALANLRNRNSNSLPTKHGSSGGSIRIESRPRTLLLAEAEVQELRRTERLAARQVPGLGEGASSPRAPGAHNLGSFRGGKAKAHSLSWSVRRLPRPAGGGVEDLSRPLRQQQILGERERRRPSGRRLRLRRPHRRAPGASLWTASGRSGTGRERAHERGTSKRHARLYGEVPSSAEGKEAGAIGRGGRRGRRRLVSENSKYSGYNAADAR
jgi:hypothetical protein